MSLRWGFKSEANATARQVRDELGLGRSDPLNPWALAKLLEIDVAPLSSFKHDAPVAMTHFAVTAQGDFSAVTVFRGSERMIVHNDAHHASRQASNMSHELAHGLLMHPPTPPFNDRGNRLFDPDREEEADWLAGALLVSEEAALEIIRRSWPEEVAMTRFGISRPMLQFRLNVTGARRRVLTRRPTRTEA